MGRPLRQRSIPPRTEQNSGKPGTKAVFNRTSKPLTPEAQAIITEERMAVFLKHYQKTGRLRESIDVARIDWRIFKQWEEFPDFAEQFQAVEEKFVESLEKEVYRRGVEGWDEPVYQMGQKVGSRRKYDSTLLLAMLKVRKPEYRDGASVNIANAISNQTTNINGNVTIIEDSDWYGNEAHDLAAEASAAHIAGPALPGEVQTTGVRKTVEQNSHGNAGGVKGSRKA